MYELLRSVLARAEPRGLRFRISAAHARTFEVQATPLDMPSGRGALAILHDVTDLERLEQVRKDFVANVSHEFRTPLAGIIGYAETLLDGALVDAQNNRRFVEIIRTNAVRLGSIASDLLALSELESGTDPPEPEVISVRGVLEAALVTVKSEAAAFVLASLNVVTTPENIAPSVAAMPVPCALKVASATTAELVAVIDDPPASAICTETV